MNTKKWIIFVVAAALMVGAAGALGWLKNHQRLGLPGVRTHVIEGEPEGSLEIDQGDEIGHPSTISLSWHPAGASLGGTVRRDEVRVLEV